MSGTTGTNNTVVKRAVGNTNTALSRVRSRNWFMTFNNYEQEDIDILLCLSCTYLFQEEMGKNGTPHLQGVFMFKNPMSLSTMKKIDKRIHWEPVKSKEDSIAYCCKSNSLNGERFHNFDIKPYLNKYDEKSSKKKSNKLPDANEQWRYSHDSYEEYLQDKMGWESLAEYDEILKKEPEALFYL